MYLCLGWIKHNQLGVHYANPEKPVDIIQPHFIKGYFAKYILKQNTYQGKFVNAK